MCLANWFHYTVRRDLKGLGNGTIVFLLGFSLGMLTVALTMLVIRTFLRRLMVGLFKVYVVVVVR